jgi:hypothetical protein
MNYKEALKNLKKFKALADKKNNLTKADNEQLYMQYGAIEEVINRFGGVGKVEVPQDHGLKPVIYNNFIEAGYLSGRTFHTHQGYSQLLKVIGKIKQLAKDPDIPHHEVSITHLIQTVRRFRECCQYIKNPPQDEKEVQDILWIMLRSQFERVEREETLPKFGAKAYRPDFGIPDLGVLIEVKFIGKKTRATSIQEEILADIPGYLNEATSYQSVIELIYDYSQQLRDSKAFVDALRSVNGIVEVVVIPGIG